MLFWLSSFDGGKNKYNKVGQQQLEIDFPKNLTRITHENSTGSRILLIIHELLDFRFSHSVTMLRVSNLHNSKLINNLLRFATIIVHNAG